METIDIINDLIQDILDKKNIVYIANKYNISFYEARKLKLDYGDKFSKRKNEFLELLKDTSLSYEDIAIKMNLSKSRIDEFAKAWDVDFYSKCGGRTKYFKHILKNNKDAKEELKKLYINENKDVKTIAEEFNVNKHGLGILLKKIKQENKEEKEKFYKETINNINKDILEGITYSELIEKYKLTKTLLGILKYRGLGDLMSFFREKRNKDFMIMFKNGSKAEEILKSDINLKCGPLKLDHTETIYDIINKAGIHKNNMDDFTDDLWLEINNLLKLEASHKFIVNYLNNKNYKTIHNKKFTISNLHHYIEKIKKQNGQIQTNREEITPQ